MNSVTDALSAVLITLRHLNYQKKFLTERITPLLRNASIHNDGSLGESDFKKITDYYGLAVPAILGESFCVLHNKPFTEKERITSTAQGAMTGLFDDFFDKENSDVSGIRKKINPDFTGVNENERLFLQLYNLALENTDPELLKEALEKVYAAQVESRKQIFALDRQELMRITAMKGGESLLFYRMAIDRPLGAEEKSMLFSAGALMQLCNDIFDIYKDRESGIHTLATCTMSIDDLKNIFVLWKEEFLQRLKRTPFRDPCKRKFFMMLSVAIFSRTEVCISHLAKIQKIYGIFNVHTCSRKQLICDMDNMKNRLKNVYFASRSKM